MMKNTKNIENVLNGEKNLIVAGRNVRLYRSMYDYVEDADFGYYEIQDGKERETPFVEAVKPQKDPNFGIWINDTISIEGNTYVRVNFGEDDEVESFILECALDEEVFLIYNEIEIEGNEAAYRANAICYRTEEDATNALETVTKHDEEHKEY